MTESLKKGESVSWKSSNGKVQGTVVRKTIQKEKIKGHTVAADTKNPEYIVKSKKTGAKAAHKAAALKKA